MPITAQQSFTADHLVLFNFSKGGRSMEANEVNGKPKETRLADGEESAPAKTRDQSVRWTTDTIIVNGNPLTILFPETG